MTEENKKRTRRIFAAALLLLASLALAAGAALARYQLAAEGEWQMRTAVKPGLTLTDETVTPLPNGFTDVITVTNQSSETVSFTVRTLVSAGVGDPGNIDVQLSAGLMSYEDSAPAAITEGSAVWRSFGSGWIFQFEERAGEDLALSVEPDGSLELTISVTRAELGGADPGPAVLPEASMVRTELSELR